MAKKSLLVDAPFTRTTLTYQGAGSWGTGDDGQPILVPGAPKKLTALIAPSRADQLRYLPGADVELVVGRGELIDPLTLPAEVAVGTVLTCTYAGRVYELTITNVIVNDLVGVDFGDYFGFTMRPVP